MTGLIGNKAVGWLVGWSWNKSDRSVDDCKSYSASCQGLEVKNSPGRIRRTESAVRRNTRSEVSVRSERNWSVSDRGADLGTSSWGRGKVEARETAAMKTKRRGRR